MFASLTITFSIKNEDIWTKQVSFSDSDTINLESYVDSFSESDSERFQFPDWAESIGDNFQTDVLTHRLDPHRYNHSGSE